MRTFVDCHSVMSGAVKVPGEAKRVETPVAMLVAQPLPTEVNETI